MENCEWGSKICAEFEREIMKKRDHFEALRVEKRIILK
jgi:hypothetical protein